jgi:hypothetical protein
MQIVIIVFSVALLFVNYKQALYENYRKQLNVILENTDLSVMFSEDSFVCIQVNRFEILLLFDVNRAKYVNGKNK